MSECGKDFYDPNGIGLAAMLRQSCPEEGTFPAGPVGTALAVASDVGWRQGFRAGAWAGLALGCLAALLLGLLVSFGLAG